MATSLPPCSASGLDEQDLVNQIQNLRNQLEEQKRQIDEQKRQFEEQKRQLDDRSLNVLKRKYNVIENCTLSEHYESSKYPPVKVVKHTIGDLLKKNARYLTDDFLSTPYVGDTDDDCDSEASVVSRVKQLIDAVIKGLKINDSVQTVQNRTLAGTECDILLVYKPNRLPFAIVEVKKPPHELEKRKKLFAEVDSNNVAEVDSNNVAAQIYAEMKGVHLFGFRKVYGLLTTFNHFQLYCTETMNDKQGPNEQGPNEEELLDTTMTNAWEFLTPNTSTNRQPSLSSSSSGHSPEQKTIKAIREPEQNPPITVHCCQVVPDIEVTESSDIYGVEVLKLVLTFITKALETLRTLLLDVGVVETSINLHQVMPCRIITQEDKKFAFGTWKPTEKINLENLDNPFHLSEKFEIYIVHHLGMGGSGNCCLGASRDAKSFCAIKFYHKHAQKKEDIEAECNNWKNIYKKENFNVRVLHVAGGYCLFMPYMMPIAKNERAELLRNGSITKTLRDFAKSKFRHLDIKWRHFRRWQGNIYLIDLGAVEKIPQEESADFWVKQQIDLLENDMKKNSNKKSRTDSQGTESQSTDSQSTETSMESTGIV